MNIGVLARVGAKSLNNDWVKVSRYWVTCFNQLVVGMKATDNGIIDVFKAEKNGSIADTLAKAELLGATPYIGFPSLEGYKAFTSSTKLAEDMWVLHKALQDKEDPGISIIVDYSAVENSRITAAIAGAIDGALKANGYGYLEDFQDTSSYYNSKGQYVEHDKAMLKDMFSADIYSNVKIQVGSCLPASYWD